MWEGCGEGQWAETAYRCGLRGVTYDNSHNGGEGGIRTRSTFNEINNLCGTAGMKLAFFFSTRIVTRG